MRQRWMASSSGGKVSSERSMALIGEHRGPAASITRIRVASDQAAALEAVGLTAAVSRVLTDARISANVVAGYTHDRVFVPQDRASDAMRALAALASP